MYGFSGVVVVSVGSAVSFCRVFVFGSFSQRGWSHETCVMQTSG